MNKYVTYLSEIVSALEYYDGMASLKEINDYIEKRNILPNIHTNANWKRNVSAVIQRHCSMTKSYDGRTDLFYSVYGIGEGFWGLKSMHGNFGRETSPIIVREITKIEKDDTLKSTVKETIIKARVGQGLFRKRLLEKYNNRCIITGIDDVNLLIASHIKPWRSANNSERISDENGLLLSPLYDKMFDLGLITFDCDMKLKVSAKLSDKNINLINIDCNTIYIHNPSNELCKNMEFHRKNVFLD